MSADDGASLTAGNDAWLLDGAAAAYMGRTATAKHGLIALAERQERIRRAIESFVHAARGEAAGEGG